MKDQHRLLHARQFCREVICCNGSSRRSVRSWVTLARGFAESAHPLRIARCKSGRHRPSGIDCTTAEAPAFDHIGQSEPRCLRPGANLARCGHQDHRANSLRIIQNKALGDHAAHRNAQQVHRVETGVLEYSRQVRGVILQRIRPRRPIRLAKSPQVRPQDAMIAREDGHKFIPHVTVATQAMKQHQSRTLAFI